MKPVIWPPVRRSCLAVPLRPCGRQTAASTGAEGPESASISPGRRGARRESLGRVAPLRAQQGRLGRPLDALVHEREPEGMDHGDDRADDGRRGLVLVHPRHEGLIDRQHVDDPVAQDRARRRGADEHGAPELGRDRWQGRAVRSPPSAGRRPKCTLAPTQRHPPSGVEESRSFTAAPRTTEEADPPRTRRAGSARAFSQERSGPRPR